MHRWASFVLLTVAASAVSTQRPPPIVPLQPVPIEIPVRPQPPRPAKHTAPVPAGPLRFDRFGDPLPAGAIARFGTSRLRHGTEPSALVFTPDAKHLASLSGSDDSLRLWDPATGKEVARLSVSVSSAAFARDGSVVVVDDDGKGKVWFPATGTVRDLPADALPVGAGVLAVHPDGRSFAVAGGTAVALIDTASGKTRGELKSPEGQSPMRLLYSPDGRWLAATGGQKSGVWLWDLRLMKRVRSYRSESDSIEFGFSPDGAKLIICAERLQVYSTDAEEADEGFTPPDMALLNPRFSTDGKSILALTQEGAVLRLDAATGEAKDTWEPPEGTLRAPFALAADAALAAGTDDTGFIRIWDPKTGKEPDVERLSQLAEPWLAPDGKTAAMLDNECRIRTWDTATGKEVKVTELPVDESVVVTWDPRSGRAAAFLGEGEVEVHFIDIASGKVVSKVGAPGPPGSRSVAFCPSDPARAAVFAHANVTVVHVPTGRPLRSLAVTESGGNWRGAFSPDGRLIAVTTKPLTVWEVTTGKKRFDVEAADDPHGVVFSRDGRTLAVWDGSESVLLLDVRTGAVIRRLRHTSPSGSVTTLAFAPDGRRLATGGEDGVVSVWDAATGDVTVSLRGHDAAVSGLAFSRDGSRLVSTSADGTALLWDMTLPPRPRVVEAPLSSADALRLLGDPDAAAAQRGMNYFYQHPVEAVKLLGEKVTAGAGMSAERVEKLLADLDSDAFPTREAAAKELEAAGPSAAAALRRAAEKSVSAEVRKTAAEILAKVEGVPTRPNDLRAIRAVEVLESIGTHAAKQVLARWAAGPAGTWLTAEAAAALERLDPP
jgi:WD40 repeat protein